ncbi:hypothetical protein RN001_006381 [Aquatica leii]|uniref:RAP domain-containing protein n=1 Tax=Aquatica leii TaxID=1421715 RepID=A0AAN7PDF8_9COLE|nr:hypothetical protein RN001_006381 [Aquatica leii]
MFKVTHNIARYAKSNCGAHFLLLNNFTSAPKTASIRNIEQDNESISETKKLNTVHNTRSKDNNSLVAAAFASLKSDGHKEIKLSSSEMNVSENMTVDELLSVADENGVSRKHALKVISVLAEWSSTGKAELSQFDSDPRFLKICKILTKRSYAKKPFLGTRSEDLSTIINVTADDEAAKLISSISLPQMVKVITTLAQRKRRSTPLLRSLAYNIAGNSDHLDLKECADILYSTSVLNFIDENMLEKVCSDICIAIPSNNKGSAAVGSILTSLGHLRYKDTGILDTLSDWVLKNNDICRTQDIFSLFVTLASLNHRTSNVEEMNAVLIPQLKEAEISKPTVWLDFVWSLVVLNQAKPEHVSSVLRDDFIKKLEPDDNMNVPARLKLLHINSASKLLLSNYDGPRLSDDTTLNSTLISRSKHKFILVNALQDTISNLVNTKTHLKTNTYTGMGFYIDAELALDKKCNPLPINMQKDMSNCVKVAVIVLDFHDMCRGRVEPNGHNSLYFRLLEAEGYRILPVPYTEFNPQDKLVNRVKYIETNLKRLVLN